MVRHLVKHLIVNCYLMGNQLDGICMTLESVKSSHRISVHLQLDLVVYH